MKEVSPSHMILGLVHTSNQPSEPRDIRAPRSEDPILMKLFRVCRHVERNYAGTITLADAAGIAGFEKTYFSRSFKSRLGIGFARFVREVRVAHALPMLRDSQLPVIEIAQKVGYTDISTFERNFKASQGMSPREYRKRHGIEVALLPLPTEALTGF